MSRARANREQDKETFLLQNPDFDLILTTVGESYDGEDGFTIEEELVGDGVFTHNTQPFTTDPAIGTVTDSTLGPFAGIDGFNPPDGVDTLLLESPPIFSGANLGLTADGIGVLSADEIEAGGQSPFPDGFDTINDSEVLEFFVGGFNPVPTGTGAGFNFLVQDGSGTVELLLVNFNEQQGGPNILASQKFTADVGAGATEGGLSGGLEGGFDAAYIGVTGDLEITVTGIGLSGDFDTAPF